MRELPRWSFFKTTCGLLVRNAEGSADLERVRSLRHEVFGSLSPSIRTILERRDLQSEHILIFVEATGQLVGCCRLTCASITRDLDVADFFDLTELLARPGAKVELSYACVSPDQRNGLVIRLMLSAVRDFCAFHGASTIFGCASLGTADRSEALRVYDVLKTKNLERRGMSPLLRFYHHLGAVVLAPPILDPNFSCFDFFMALDFTSITDAIWRQILGL